MQYLYIVIVSWILMTVYVVLFSYSFSWGAKLNFQAVIITWSCQPRWIAKILHAKSRINKVPYAKIPTDKIPYAKSALCRNSNCPNALQPLRAPYGYLINSLGYIALPGIWDWRVFSLVRIRGQVRRLHWWAVANPSHIHYSGSVRNSYWWVHKW